MITVRRSRDRGHFDHGWLDTYHSFSFADYHDPAHMGFRALRVINEDRVAPRGGFSAHPHRDMEIVTYIISGALEHKDSMGNGSIIRSGEFQRMTAGTGVIHSEFNPSETEAVHLLQIWMFPDQRGLTPEYEQRAFAPSADAPLRLVVSGDGRESSLRVHQDVSLYLGRLAAGQEVQYDLPNGRHAWLQVMSGSVTTDGGELASGDGAAVSDESRLAIRSTTGTEFLLFDLV